MRRVAIRCLATTCLLALNGCDGNFETSVRVVSTDSSEVCIQGTRNGVVKCFARQDVPAELADAELGTCLVVTMSQNVDILSVHGLCKASEPSAP